VARTAVGQNQYTAKALAAEIRKAESGERSSTINDGGGLVLRKRGGHWFWYFRTTSPETKRDVWISLAERSPYPNTSLADARETAKAYRVKADSGIDPQEERRRDIAAKAAEKEAQAEAQLRTLTIRTLFARWRETDLALVVKGENRSGRKDGGAYVEQQFERHVFPHIGDIQATNVRRADIMAVLDAIKLQGANRTANIILALLRQMFRFAAKRDLIQGDPTFGIDKRDAGGKDNERDRILSEPEIRELAAKVPTANLNPRTEAALWLLLATAARVGELIKAEWSHVDAMARVWTIPAENSKNGKAHQIQLSDLALTWFEKLAALRTNAVWVFPNIMEQSHVCTKTINKQFSDRQRTPEQRMSNRASNTTALALSGGKWVPHDLRRTAASLMQSLDVSTDVIDRCLNHTEQNKVTRTYQRNEMIPQRTEAFRKLGAHLEILARTDTENVVTLTSRKKRA
jgi:integrase